MGHAASCQTTFCKSVQNTHSYNCPNTGLLFVQQWKSRSSSREVRIRLSTFSVVYFRRGTLPSKKETVKGHLAGGPRSVPRQTALSRWIVDRLACTRLILRPKLSKVAVGSCAAEASSRTWLLKQRLDALRAVGVSRLF